MNRNSLRFIFLFFLMVFAAFRFAAAQDVILSLPDLKAKAGDEINVKVKIENVSELFGFRIIFDLPNFSPDFPLEYVPQSSTVRGTMSTGWSTIENDKSQDVEGNSRFPGAVLINGSGISALEGSGNLLRFDLRVKEDAADQTVPLTFRLTGSRVTRLNDGALPFIAVNGSVTIGEEDDDDDLTPSPSPTSATPTITATPTSATAELTPTPTVTPTFIPTPTPTPTPTPPTGAVVIVTDNEDSETDLSNSQDHDPANDREMVVKWDLSSLNGNGDDGGDGDDRDDDRDSEFSAFHVNVRIDQTGEFVFLGRTPNAKVTSFTWKKNGRLTEKAFRDGPQFFHQYEFRIFGIRKDKSQGNAGPFHNAGPVEFLPMITVTDTVDDFQDLSNGQDFDLVQSRELVIRWLFDPDDIAADNVEDFHVFVRVNNSGGYRFLGKAGNPNAAFLEWKQGQPGLEDAFRNGPLFNNRYQFRIFAIKKQGPGRAFGPFDAAGPVEYLLGIDPAATATFTPSNTPTITPLPTPTETPTPLETFTSTPIPTPTNTFVPSLLVTVTDNLDSTVDLSGREDHDGANRRELVIRWDVSSAGISSGDLRAIHVYIKSDLDNEFVFFSRTGTDNAGVLRWNPGNRDIKSKFRSGPEFFRSYSFRVFTVPRGDDQTGVRRFDTAAPVTFLPMVTVTDSVHTFTDLSNGQDFDAPDERELAVRWRIDPTEFDGNAVTDFHVFAQINNARKWEYIGRTASGNAAILDWSEDAQFLSPSFREGPQFNNRYAFRVFPIAQNGSFGGFDGTGSVEYLQGDSSSPETTPTLTFTPTLEPTLEPTLAPSPTPTITLTPTPTTIPLRINGRIRTLFGGSPIEGAEIRIGEIIGFSDDEGKYEILLPTGGSFGVNVSAAGFRDFITTLRFNDSQQLNIRLRPGSDPSPTPTPKLISISGFIFDEETFDAVVNAEVEIAGRTAETDQNGFYFFADIIEGEHTLKISADEFEPFEETITADDNLEIITPLTKLG